MSPGPPTATYGVNMSEAWDDITGSIEKPSKPLITPTKNQEFRHESEERTAERRGKALEAIFKLFPDPKYNANGMITAEVKQLKFDLWPASDCWFSYSKQRYGSGIESLCSMIEKHLKEKN